MPPNLSAIPQSEPEASPEMVTPSVPSTIPGLEMTEIVDGSIVMQNGARLDSNTTDNYTNIDQLSVNDTERLLEENFNNYLQDSSGFSYRAQSARSSLLRIKANLNNSKGHYNVMSVDKKAELLATVERKIQEIESIIKNGLPVQAATSEPEPIKTNTKLPETTVSGIISPAGQITDKGELLIDPLAGLDVEEKELTTDELAEHFKEGVEVVFSDKGNLASNDTPFELVKIDSTEPKTTNYTESLSPTEISSTLIGDSKEIFDTIAYLGTKRDALLKEINDLATGIELRTEEEQQNIKLQLADKENELRKLDQEIQANMASDIEVKELTIPPMIDSVETADGKTLAITLQNQRALLGSLPKNEADMRAAVNENIKKIVDELDRREAASKPTTPEVKIEEPKKKSVRHVLRGMFGKIFGRK